MAVTYFTVVCLSWSFWISRS